MIEDEEIRLALAIDSKGMCLRHPNIEVATTTNSSKNEIVPKMSFRACKVCRSELAAGGLKLQRKSMAYSIQAVQELHHDRRRWDNFKQNWKNGSNEVDEPGDDSGKFEVEFTPAVTKENTEKHFKHFNENDVTGNVTLPKNQNEIVRDALLRGSQVHRWLLLEKTNEIDKLKKEIESLRMENDILRKEMRDQKDSFEETIRRQEKTINQELKMIKSIASQRAVNRTTKTSHPNESEPGIHQSHSSLVHSCTTSLSLSISSHDAPHELPVRLDKDGATIASSPDLSISIDPPKLPTSPNSNQLETMTKNSTKPKVSPRSVRRKLSGIINPLAVSQRQTSEEVDTTTGQSNILQYSADTEAVGPLHSVQLNRCKATDFACNSSIHSITEDQDRSTYEIAMQSLKNKEPSGSHEISFVPTESERIVRTTSITDAAGNLQKECQEIEFDVTIRFDTKQQLLLEASQAISVGSIPTTSQRHRKLSPKESADSSSETPQEIIFDTTCITPHEQNRPGNMTYDLEKANTDKQLLQERVFGKSARTSAEDEEDDFGIPSELPVNSDRYLECERETMNLSPVSALTSASYMFDAGFGGSAEEEVIEPRKALQNTPHAKRLPMEENFDSDDDTKPDDRNVVPMKLRASASTHRKQTPRRATKKVLNLENEVVHDKYGDGGMYSGYVSLKDRLPHGVGKMIYDNGREYEGDWKGGRWHGKFKMSPRTNSSL
jgi:hypothetical protein